MSEPIKRYTDLTAWQRAFQMGLDVHVLAGKLPDFERFGLMAQLRRSAPEVAACIARGYGAGQTGEYVRQLKFARGEIYKIDTLLLFALELKYINDDQFQPVKSRVDEAERVLAGLIRSLGG